MSDNSNNQAPDLTTKVNSSVSGFVTNENDVPVLGATVQAGTGNATTDKFGFFEIKNVQVVKEAAVVTVSKPGYFKGIKTYYAKGGKAAFFRVKLIPKTAAGSFNATSGGTVTLTNGLGIALPSNAIVNASTNATYTGTVNVAAHWINPTTGGVITTMPGDLRGIDVNNSMKALTSFGMAAVELTGSGGELLQIANGKKANLTFPIPASILSTAPASIPLWYFDEATGLWKEQGTATKSGNTYVGEVSHFSFWNCDAPSSYIEFDCTIVDAAGNPIQNALVRVSAINAVPGWQTSGYGYTNAAGYISGVVPNSSQLLLQVYGSWSCSPTNYSQTITTTNTNLSLGTITIATGTLSSTVSGTLLDCSNNPVTNGYVIFQNNNGYNRCDVSNGTFSFTQLLCSSTSYTGTLIGVDNSNSQQSNTQTITYTSGTNSTLNILACGTSILQFINCTIDGVSVPFSYPADSIYYSSQGTSAYSYINGYRYLPSTYDYVNFSFLNTGIGAGSTQNLSSFSSSKTSYTNIPVPINVNITEYGSVGQFISGNFTGTVHNVSPPDTAFNINCSFRVKRNY